MKVTKIPLRYSIPILILFFNLILLSVEFQTDRKYLFRQGIQNAENHLMEIGLLASMGLETALRNNNADRADDIINHIAALDHVAGVYLADQHKNIMLADDFLSEEQKRRVISEFEALFKIDTATIDLTAKTMYDDSSQVVYNLNKILMQAGAPGYLPDQTGYLIIKKDLHNELQLIRQNLYSKARINLVILLLVSLAIWAVFQFHFMNRLNAIRDGFRDPQKINTRLFNSHDEISVLVKSFYNMHLKLNQTLKRYQTILNTTNAAVAELDPNGNYIFVNKTWEKMFGYSSAEIIGKPNTILLPPGTVESQQFKHLINGIIDQYSETRKYRGKKGNIIWCELYVGSNHNSKNEIDSIVAVLFDVSGMKKIQDDLIRQNTFTKTILENIPLGVAVNRFDEGTATYINPQFERIYGWSKNDLKDVAGFFKKVYPEKNIRERLQKRVMEDINSRDPKRMRWENLEITTKTGEKRKVSAQNIPLFEQNLMISTVQDVTERERMRMDFDLIFENSIDMVCTASMDGYLLTINPAWEKTLGWSEKELKSKPFIEFIHPEDQQGTIKASSKLKKGLPALGFENRYKAKDGSYKDLSWNTIPLPGESKTLGIARDITDKKATENELEHSYELLNYVIDHSNSAIAVHDTEMRYLYVSQNYLKQFKVLEKNIIGKHHYEVFPDLPQKWRDVHKRVLKGEVISADNDAYERADGSVEWTRWECLPWYNAKKEISGLVLYTEVITEEKEAKDKIIESEAKYRRIIETANEGIWTIDENNLTTFSNEKMADMLGYNADEMEGKSLFDFMDSRGKTIASEKLNQRREGKNEQHEFVFKKKTGEDVWTLLNTNAMQDDQGRYIGALAMITDITERKTAEDRLKLSEEKFSTIFKNSPDAIFLSSLNDGEIADMNRAAEEIMGYTSDELIGKKTTKIRFWKNPEDRKAYVEMLSKSGRIQNFEADFIIKTGETRTFNSSGEIIQIEGNEYILSILQDVTDIKKVRDELFHSKQQLQNITDNIPGAIFQYQVLPDGRDTFLYVSGGAKSIWGISPEMAIEDNQFVWNRIHSEDLGLLKESIRKSYQELKPWNLEFRIIMPGESPSWAEGIGIPQKKDDGSVVWDALILNVTERKEALHKLEDYKQSLQELTTELSLAEEKQRKEIAANIHDHLSQSLVISKMKINDLQKKSEVEPYQKDLLSISKHITDALENSRRITYDLSPPVLYEMGLVETMYWLKDNLEQERNMQIDFLTDIEELHFTDATLILLFRSIQEVLFNIIKHADASQALIRFTLREQSLTIEIQDNGKGFDISMLESERKNKKSFGLFKVRERIHNLNGQFSISSNPGNGTLVTFSLPYNNKPQPND